MALVRDTLQKYEDLAASRVGRYKSKYQRAAETLYNLEYLNEWKRQSEFCVFIYRKQDKKALEKEIMKTFFQRK